MKIIIIIFTLIISSTLTYAQSIVIGSGAELNATSGADVCATYWGNISGNATGSGTQCNGVMPVELLTFSVSVYNTSVSLNWQTATETNNKGFEVQRNSINGNDNWISAGFVNGSGTKTTPTNYKFEDKKLKVGKYEYRLKQSDYNGNYEYHNLTSIAEIGVPTKFELSQNYPNPFNPATKIDFQIPMDSKVTLKIYDITGKEIAMLINNEFKSADYYTVSFNAVNLASGMYFYRIITDKFTSVKKMVMIK
jgi:hypothetical protein